MSETMQDETMIPEFIEYEMALANIASSVHALEELARRYPTLPTFTGHQLYVAELQERLGRLSLSKAVAA